MMAMPWPTAAAEQVTTLERARNGMRSRPSPASISAMRWIMQSGHGGSPIQSCAPKAAARIGTRTHTFSVTASR